MSRKIFPGTVSVLRDRPLQGIEPVVLLLVAQLLEEADLQMAAIKLLVAIEQMHLQQRHRDRVHRRSPANAGHPRAEAFDLHGKDAAERRLPPQRDVGGGKSQGAAQLRAVRHPAAEGIRVSQQPLGAAQIARAERAAHRGARHPLAFEQHIGHRFQAESVAHRRLLERSKIAGAPRAEAEVAADEQPARAEPLQQHVLDEALSRKRRKARVETHDVHALDARRRQQLELVAQAGQARRRRVAVEERDGVAHQGRDVGSWLIHFIGMMAFSLPVPLAYDIGITILSMLAAVAASGVALYTVRRPAMTPGNVTLAGTIMGAGICVMHYTGMAAMRMSPPIAYDPVLFVASVLVAIIASLSALWIAFQLRQRSEEHTSELQS